MCDLRAVVSSLFFLAELGCILLPLEYDNFFTHKRGHDGRIGLGVPVLPLQGKLVRALRGHYGKIGQTRGIVLSTCFTLW